MTLLTFPMAVHSPIYPHILDRAGDHGLALAPSFPRLGGDGDGQERGWGGGGSACPSPARPSRAVKYRLSLFSHVHLDLRITA